MAVAVFALAVVSKCAIHNDLGSVVNFDLTTELRYNLPMNEFPNSPADMIERIMQTAKAALPEGLSADIKQGVRNAIQEVISDLDVVTREELEVQKEVLAKTRAKVDQMELIISDLERQLDIK